MFMSKRNVIKLLNARDLHIDKLMLELIAAKQRQIGNLDNRIQSLTSQLEALSRDVMAHRHGQRDALSTSFKQIEERLAELASRAENTAKAPVATPNIPESSVRLFHIPERTEHKIAIVKLIKDFTMCELHDAVACVSVAQGYSGITVSSRGYETDNIKINSQRLSQGKNSRVCAVELYRALRDYGCEVRITD